MPQNATSGATVTVACKLPHGLHLEVPASAHAPRAASETEPNPKAIAVPRTRFTVNGWHSAKKGGRVVGSYGLTEGIPADFFAKWMHLHADTPLVTRGFLFAMDNTSNAEGKAREQASIKSGFEGCDPSNPGAGLEPLKQS